MKLLLFDIDLTLLRSGGAGLRALNRAFQAVVQLENAMTGVAPHGKTDPGIVREIFEQRLGRTDVPNSVCAEILSAYVRFLEEEIQVSTAFAVMPGVPDLIRELDAHAGTTLGLATGNVERGARIKLERAGLNHYFPFGGYGSDSEGRDLLVRCAAQRGMEAIGRNIPPHDVFVIGDTPRDIAAGKASGFSTIGVATGHYGVDELRDCGADAVISDFAAGRAQFLRATFIE